MGEKRRGGGWGERRGEERGEGERWKGKGRRGKRERRFELHC